MKTFYQKSPNIYILARFMKMRQYWIIRYRVPCLLQTKNSVFQYWFFVRLPKQMLWKRFDIWRNQNLLNTWFHVISLYITRLFFFHNLTQLSQQSQESQQAPFHTYFKSAESDLSDSKLTWLTWLKSDLTDLIVKQGKSDLSQVNLFWADILKEKSKIERELQIWVFELWGWVFMQKKAENWDDLTEKFLLHSKVFYPSFLIFEISKKIHLKW